jgi:hypothetical protein
MSRVVLIAFAAALSLPVALTAQHAPDHHLPSRPETVTWGDYPLDRAPVLRMRSGETVRIDALSHAGATQSDEPVAFMASLGVPKSEVLQDAIDFWHSRAGRPREGRSGHVITGPI